MEPLKAPGPRRTRRRAFCWRKPLLAPPHRFPTTARQDRSPSRATPQPSPTQVGSTAATKRSAIRHPRTDISAMPLSPTPNHRNAPKSVRPPEAPFLTMPTVALREGERTTDMAATVQGTEPAQSNLRPPSSKPKVELGTRSTPEPSPRTQPKHQSR